jgi:hypothetical protein
MLETFTIEPPELREKERAWQIHSEHFQPVLCRMILERLEDHRSGIIDQDMHPATVVLDVYWLLQFAHIGVIDCAESLRRSIGE